MEKKFKVGDIVVDKYGSIWEILDWGKDTLGEIKSTYDISTEDLEISKYTPKRLLKLKRKNDFITQVEGHIYWQLSEGVAKHKLLKKSNNDE